MSARTRPAVEEFTDGWVNKRGVGRHAERHNSSYNEGDSLPVRLRALNQTSGNHTVVVKFDFTDTAGVHFLDLIDFVRPDGHERGEPVRFPSCHCQLRDRDDGSNSDRHIVPAGAQPTGNFTVYNATLTAGTYSVSNGVKQLTLNYTVSGTKNVVIAFGAHLTRRNEWGPAKGASQFPGGSGKIPVGRADHGLQAHRGGRAEWRSVHAPHLVALVRAAAKFDKGVRVERNSEQDQEAAA